MGYDFDPTDLIEEIKKAQKALAGLVSSLDTTPIGLMAGKFDAIASQAFTSKESVMRSVMASIKPVLPDRY
jgi:hypothetical protein